MGSLATEWDRESSFGVEIGEREGVVGEELFELVALVELVIL